MRYVHRARKLGTDSGNPCQTRCPHWRPQAIETNYHEQSSCKTWIGNFSVPEIQRAGVHAHQTIQNGQLFILCRLYVSLALKYVFVSVMQHEAIAEFPSKQFYQGKLTTGRDSQRRPSQFDFWPGGRNRPMAFVHLGGSEESLVNSSEEGGLQSKKNLEQAQLAVNDFYFQLSTEI